MWGFCNLDFWLILILVRFLVSQSKELEESAMDKCHNFKLLTCLLWNQRKIKCWFYVQKLKNTLFVTRETLLNEVKRIVDKFHKFTWEMKPC